MDHFELRHHFIMDQFMAIELRHYFIMDHFELRHHFIMDQFMVIELRHYFIMDHFELLDHHFDGALTLTLSSIVDQDTLMFGLHERPLTYQCTIS